MTNAESNEPEKAKIFNWKVVLGILFVLFLIGQFSGGTKSNDSGSSSSSSTTTAQKADVGTRMACEHWRINLRNAAVETREQQVANAQKVNRYASVSENPDIVSAARAMTEAFLVQDGEAYLAAGTAFGNACTAAGQ